MEGASWVLRDHNGETLIHVRRVFLGFAEEMDFKLVAAVRMIQSMEQHRRNRVIFAFQDEDLVGMVLRPKAWPSFRFMSSEILRYLAKIEWWRMVKEEKITNRGAFLIAQSVITSNRLQSYVAYGGPSWLSDLFDGEKT